MQLCGRFLGLHVSFKITAPGISRASDCYESILVLLQNVMGQVFARSLLP